MVNGLFEAVHGVYAAGSVASYFDPIMGRRRIATYDHCVNSGLYAGESKGVCSGIVAYPDGADSVNVCFNCGDTKQTVPA